MAVRISSMRALQDTLSLIGYSEYKADTATRLIVFTEDDRKVTLQSIANELGGKYTSSKSGPGWKSSVGSTKVGTYTILAKPSSKTGSAGALSSLDARIFSGSGISTKFSYHGQDIDCVKFTKPKQIEESIVSGCASSPLLGRGIADAYVEFFNTGSIAWSPSTPAPVKNKLGVYTGEVLVGWVFLSKKQNSYFITNPFRGVPKAFYLPTDPAFSGVDSFIEMSDGSFYSISSKFGAGAKASLFSNLLEKGMKKTNSLTKSVFKDLCLAANNNNLTYKNARDIVYTFGVRNILGISSSVIANPSDVYTQIVSNNMKSEAKAVVAAIKNYKPQPVTAVMNNLPNSVSNFFNRAIADKLNSDVKSITQMKEILQGKDYWQGNLQISEWSKGVMKFKWLSSADAELSIIGSKGSASDITSKQGWINYELRYK